MSPSEHYEEFRRISSRDFSSLTLGELVFQLELPECFRFYVAQIRQIPRALFVDSRRIIK